jgi:Na+/H+ antiporter NhaC
MATPDMASLPAITWTILEPALTSPFNLSIYLFTALLLGMVGIQLKAGGLHAVVDKLARRAKTRESAQVATASMGVAVFFDDYANSVVVGASARPLADRFKISREKLAYIVDSTAAPISGIAVISTWVGYEVSQFNAQLSALEPVASSGYEVFFAILPYRFYCIVSVLMVFVVAYTGRDFGPMLKAERRTQTRPQTATQDTNDEALLSLSPDPATPRRWQTGVFPVLTVLMATLGAYAWFARDGIEHIAPWTLTYWQDAFRIVGDMMDGNLGMYILVGAAAAGAVVATCLALAYRQLSLAMSARSFGRAVWTIGPTLVVLALAISIRSAVGLVHADWFLVTLVGPLDPIILPVTVFFLAAVTAFCTGTSWGTMGILMPVVIPLVADQVLGSPEAGIILALSTAAVLDGAIFGDHCSPISDTTVMSSMATGCDHIEHVRTQFPYAMVAMFAAALFGYVLIASQHTPAILSWILGAVFVLVITRVLGRRSASSVVPTKSAS